MPADLTPILAWLTGASLKGLPIGETLAGLGERMVAAGIPIERAHVSTAALHPMVSAFSLDWEPGGPCRRSSRSHDMPVNQGWTNSPLRHMILNNEYVLRQRFEGANEAFRFPVFQEFAEAGLTDWIARAESFEWASQDVPGGLYGMVCSWATRRPGGFSDDEEQAIHLIVASLALAVKTSFMDAIARDVLGAYLGADAAARVLTGAITRGTVTEISAVVMMADIKGFTRFSTHAPLRGRQPAQRQFRLHRECGRRPWRPHPEIRW